MEIMQEEKTRLLELLAERLLHQEYQIKNQDQLTTTDLDRVTKDYGQDRERMIRLIMAVAEEMDYPSITQWPDTKPMATVSAMSNHQLAKTKAYQEILDQLLLA